MSLLIIIANACKPDSFTLHKHKDDLNSKIRQIDGLIMSDLDSFEKINDNTILLKNNAVVAMRLSKVTQLRAQFLVEVLKGNGVLFNFHSVSDNFATHSKIAFKYFDKEISLWKDSVYLYQNFSKRNRKDLKEWVVYENYGDNLRLIVGCDTVFNKKINSIATEYLILETDKDSEVKLESILFSDINKL
ncbi:MAG: hypothetical protein GX121_09995 [Ignavibacteria bacterium]|nr:hypothetical protein [Ignavibacteria bacterium]